jgi:hypothetical protein
VRGLGQSLLDRESEVHPQRRIENLDSCPA